MTPSTKPSVNGRPLTSCSTPARRSAAGSTSAAPASITHRRASSTACSARGTDAAASGVVAAMDFSLVPHPARSRERRMGKRPRSPSVSDGAPRWTRSRGHSAAELSVEVSDRVGDLVQALHGRHECARRGAELRSRCRRGDACRVAPERGRRRSPDRLRNGLQSADGPLALVRFCSAVLVVERRVAITSLSLCAALSTLSRMALTPAAETEVGAASDATVAPAGTAPPPRITAASRPPVRIFVIRRCISFLLDRADIGSRNGPNFQARDRTRGCL